MVEINSPADWTRNTDLCLKEDGDSITYTNDTAERKITIITSGQNDEDWNHHTCFGQFYDTTPPEDALVGQTRLNTKQEAVDWIERRMTAHSTPATFE